MPDELVSRTVGLPGGELRLLQPSEAAELPDAGAVEWAPLAPYWAVLWRSGVALARELDDPALGGLRVVELGCGLAVPSLAAARAGAEVLATDAATEALALVARNARANDVSLETAAVDVDRARRARQAGAVRPRARRRRPIRARERGAAAVAPAAPRAAGLDRRSRPVGRRGVLRGGGPALAGGDTRPRRRAPPPSGARVVAVSGRAQDRSR